MSFFIIMYLLIIHELGHFLTAYILGISTDKICIYPFGGISKFNLELNTSQHIEFLILIMGPIMQCVAYFIIINIGYMQSYSSIIKIYHYGILIFNLLPIYPLDGGKLVNIILSYKFTYKKSLILSLAISYITVLLLFIINKNNITLNIIIIVVFLIYKITYEYKRVNYIYEKFLLERYLKNYHFKDRIVINNINKLYRNKKHIIKINNKYYTEKELLQKKYKKC